VRRWLVLCLPSAAVIATFAACGARTGFDDLVEPEAGIEAGVDARVDVRADVERDAEAEAAPDVHEAGRDVEAGPDVVFRDVGTLDICPDAGSTLVYVLTEQNGLYAFYPPTLTFTKIGDVACPGSQSPFSMAVDRRGIAYTVFTDGHLFRLDTASGACQATKFQPQTTRFVTFGMGYVANGVDGGDDGGETLFIADAVLANTVTAKPDSQGLGFIDTTTYAAPGFVGPFTPVIPGPELTGTGDGRLYAFFTNAATSGSHIVEVDKTTGNILQDFPLKVGQAFDAYAFAFWGGYFWVFTATSGSPTTVTRFSPTDLSEVNVTTMPQTIVGAGVSTCAPQ
jgi:hypothetical protein